MAFNIKLLEPQTRKISPGDRDFMLEEGIMLVPRAMARISKNCPSQHKGIVEKAILYGWVEAVAYVEREK